MTPQPISRKRPNRATALSADQRDSIVAKCAQLMAAYNIGPTTLANLAQIASLEAKQ